MQAHSPRISVGHSGDILQLCLKGCEGTPGKELVGITHFLSCPKSACFSPVTVEGVEGLGSIVGDYQRFQQEQAQAQCQCFCDVLLL